MSNVFRLIDRKRIALLGFLLVVVGLTPAGASSANISHSYNGTGSINKGHLVSLDAKRSDFVELANSSNGERLIGVAVESDDSLLAVDATEGKVQVATSGSASALVSNLNGDIKVGDQVAVSPFNGVGAKAEAGATVVGLAQTDFSKETASSSQTIKDKEGNDRQIYFGYIKLNVGVGLAKADSQQQLNSLQRLARSLVGHEVSTARVVIGLIVILVTLIALIAMTYGSIYGGIVSIGRNPLAKYAIFKSLGVVMILAGLMASVAGATVYLLWR